MITVERVRSLFTLDDEGNLIRRVRVGQKAMAGTVAGSRSKRGYVKVMVDRKSLAAHRVVFAIVNGHWPDAEIDHINGVKDDNRPCNLREATRGENQRNCGIRANNKSGFKGVSWERSCDKWKAQIRIDGVTTYLGVFDTPELAAAAYAEAAPKLHGSFARPT